MRIFDSFIDFFSGINFFFTGSFNNLFFESSWSYNDIILGLTGFYYFSNNSFFIFDNFYIYLNFFNVELLLFLSILFVLIFNVYFSVINYNPYLVKNIIYFFILSLLFCIFILFDQY